jgi:hypothetical protein
MATVSAADLLLLAKFDTPTVCNVIELFEVRPRNTGFMDQRIMANFPEQKPMVIFVSRLFSVCLCVCLYACASPFPIRVTRGVCG